MKKTKFLPSVSLAFILVIFGCSDDEGDANRLTESEILEIFENTVITEGGNPLSGSAEYSVNANSSNPTRVTLQLERNPEGDYLFLMADDDVDRIGASFQILPTESRTYTSSELLAVMAAWDIVSSSTQVQYSNQSFSNDPQEDPSVLDGTIEFTFAKSAISIRIEYLATSVTFIREDGNFSLPPDEIIFGEPNTIPVSATFEFPIEAE